MNTALETKPQNETISFSLQTKLKALNEEQFLTLYTLYGQEGLNEFKEYTEDEATKNFNEVKSDLAELLAGRIEEDKNMDQKNKIVFLVNEFYDEYYPKFSHLSSLKTQTKDTNEEIKEVVRSFNSSCRRLVKDSNKTLLTQYKEDKKLEKAKARRQRRIEKGLEAHRIAVACSVIEGGRKGGEDYIEKATKEAEDVLETTVLLIEDMKKNHKQPDPLSDKGTTSILKTLHSLKKEAAKQAAGGLANLPSYATSK